MCASRFRQSPLESDITKESQASSIQFSKSHCSSLKLCPHTPASKNGSIAKTPDDGSAAESRFLNWVAYHRSLAGPSQITDDERLRCPIMWCRRLFDNQNALLEHVFNCAHYSNGWYWCFHCQMEECFSSCQCKHCQVPPFGKERLSVRVRRLLQKLGTKSHQKDHETLDSPDPTKAISDYRDNKRSEYLQQYGEFPSVAVELDIGKTFPELEADYIHGPMELGGFENILPELDSENAIASNSKQEVGSSRSGTSICRVDTGATDFTSMFGGMEAIQASPLPSSSIHDLPSQSHIGHEIKLAISDDSQLQLRSPVSPQNANWTSTSYADYISESPIGTDISGHSLFTTVSPPSTRNSTLQSFSSTSHTFDESLDHSSTSPKMQDVVKEIPIDMSTEELSGHGQASTIQADAFHSAERRDFTVLGCHDLLSPSDLLMDFWKVLRLHVVESAERLKMLTDNPAVDELLSMSAGMIAYVGFEAWRRMLSGCFPSTIAHLYSLVHFTYACAIVIYDGRVENQLQDLFSQSLSIGTRALSEEDRRIYTSITWSIWSPPMEDINLPFFSSSKPTAQLVQPIYGPSWTKGKASLHPNGSSEGTIQHLRLTEMLSTPELPPNNASEILNVLNHFMDIYEGTICCKETFSISGNLADNFKDENFIRMIKENVTNPLIEGHFQTGPSLEAFIKAVAEVDRLVSIGHITTIREVEVGLKWAGKSIAQSMELYGIFSSRVKDLCSAVSYRLRVDPALRIESHAEVINAMWINLAMIISDSSRFVSDGCYQSEEEQGSSFLASEVVDSTLDSTVNNSAVGELAQSITQAGVYRRVAIKRKRRSGSSISETASSPSSSASSNTLSEVSEGNTFCCSICDFRPTGERRWHKRTMERHLARHDPGPKKVHICDHDGCEKSFTRQDNLAQHTRQVHKRNRRQI